MRFYLSSYKLGNKFDKLKSLEGKKLAYISNALDYSDDFKRRKISEQKDIDELQELGFSVDKIDLRTYFGKKKKLKKKLESFDIVWVRGGNVFVLRQAMKLSRFDEILSEINIIYGGYSAGVCVLSDSVKEFRIMDDPNLNPYNTDIVWDGLGLIDFVIVPHFQSNHSESDNAQKLIDSLKNKNIKFKALKDGEVIII